MKWRSLIAVLAIGASCAAGPVEELARHKPQIDEVHMEGARPLDEWDDPHFFVLPTTPASRFVTSVVTSIERWANRSEAPVGYVESVLGFAGVAGRHESYRRLRGFMVYLQEADSAIQAKAAALGDELDADGVLQFEQDAVHAREVVFPLLGARAAVALAGVSSPSVERGALAKRAREVARSVEPVSAWAEAQRSAVIAGASYLLGDYEGVIEAAESAFHAAEEGDNPGGVPSTIAFEAGLIAAAIAPQADARRASVWPRRLHVLSDGKTPGFANRLALADVQFLTAKRAADSAASPRDRTRLLSEAFRAYEPVVSWVAIEAEHPSAWDHVVIAAKSGAYPYDELPLIAVVGRAGHLTSQHDSIAGVHEPAEGPRVRRATEACELLQRAIERSSRADTPDAVMAKAFFDWSNAAWGAGGELAAQSPGILVSAAERASEAGTAYSAQRLALLRVSELMRVRKDDPQVEVACVDALRRLMGLQTNSALADSARRHLTHLLAMRAANTGDDTAAAEAVSAAQAIGDPAQAQLAWTDACWARAQLLRDAWTDGDPAEVRRCAELLLVALAAADRAIGVVTPTLAAYRANAALALGMTADAAEIVDRFEPMWSEDEAIRPDAMEAVLRTRVAAGDGVGARRAAAALRQSDESRADKVIEELADDAWSDLLPLTLPLDAPDKRGREQIAPQIVAFRLAEDVAERPIHPAYDSPEATEALIRLGWALLLAGDAGAARSKFEEWINPDAHRKVVPRRPPLQLRLGRAGAMFAMGDDRAAFAVYREIADDAAFADPGGRDFWRAWTRMLEILARQNKDGARTAEIEASLSRSPGP